MSQKRTRKNSTSIGMNLKLRDIKPLTNTQQDVFDAWDEEYHLFLHGVAGTGKTFLAMYLALKEILNPEGTKNKLYIIRSSVQTREMGFLPGKPMEKMVDYENPYQMICKQLSGRSDTYPTLKTKNVVEFMSTSFLRGLTFENCIVIVDECQNMNFQELDTIITRMGQNVRIVFCGDYRQSDLKKNEIDDIKKFLNIIYNIDEFDVIEFATDDIVRSGLVKKYLMEKYNCLDNEK